MMTHLYDKRCRDSVPDQLMIKSHQQGLCSRMQKTLQLSSGHCQLLPYLQVTPLGALSFRGI